MVTRYDMCKETLLKVVEKTMYYKKTDKLYDEATVKELML